MKITGSLIVCSLAAAFTAGALLLNPDPLPPPAVVTPAAAAAAGPEVTIQQFAFSAVTALPGAVVTVRNLDQEGHTATSREAFFDTGVVGAGAAGSFTAPLAPGTYTFTCLIHPSMVGQLVVSAG